MVKQIFEEIKVENLSTKLGEDAIRMDIEPDDQ